MGLTKISTALERIQTQIYKKHTKNKPEIWNKHIKIFLFFQIYLANINLFY